MKNQISDREKVDVADKKPISILLMGSDQRKDEVGRSDSLMLFTLNPKTKSMKITSIPRDSYTEIVGKGKKIRLTMLMHLVVLIWL